METSGTSTQPLLAQSSGNIAPAVRNVGFSQSNTVKISNFQIGNYHYNKRMQGQDIALLLKLAILKQPTVQSKELAASLFISPSEVSKSLKRCVEAGLLYVSGSEKRVNSTALIEFLAHGLRYVFPPIRGSMTRGVPTAASTEPLKSRLLDDGEPPMVWPYAEGKVRGISIAPLYKTAPKAAMLDARFYCVLALSDAIRSGRTRERNLAIELIEKEIHG